MDKSSDSNNMLWYRSSFNPDFLYLIAVFIVYDSVKYLGLLAMSKILKTHPKSVQAHKDLILQCLDDRDESIRLRALDLLYGMVCSLCMFWIS